MPKPQPMPQGTKFGFLTIVEEVPASASKTRKRRMFLCVCECGKNTIVIGEKLRSGHTKSCGCQSGKSAPRGGNKPESIPNSVWIPLASHRWMLVDEQDAGLFDNKKLSLSGSGYAVWHEWVDKKMKSIPAHRIIMGLGRLSDCALFVDHINGNRLDNRRNNLRVCTHIQNHSNTKPKSTHGFKGIRQRCGKWQAEIKTAGTRIYLGAFSTAEEAAHAYDAAAKRIHGEFAWLNFPAGS